MSRRAWAGWASALVAFAGLTVPAIVADQPVRLTFLARVESVYDPGDALHEAIQPGQLLRGTITYDRSAPDANPLPAIGRYDHRRPPYGIVVEAGTYLFQSDPARVALTIELANDDGAPARDSFTVSSTSNLPFETGAVVSRISWHLTDGSRQALSSSVLTAAAPDLAKWQSEFGLTIEGHHTVDFLIRAQVTQATAGEVAPAR